MNNNKYISILILLLLIMNESSIIFQSIDWAQFHESDDIEEDNVNDDPTIENQLLKYKIRIYGRTNTGKSIFVNVENFTPYFYVEVPTDWNMTKCLSLVSYIKSKISNPLIIKGFKNFDIVERKKFYGFTNYKDFKFIRFIFLNMKSYKGFEYWIERNRINYPTLFKKPTKLQLFESNIEPFLRCMHIKKLNACGWIKVDKYVNYDVSNNDLENSDNSDNSNNSNNIKNISDISYCDINIKTDWSNLNNYEDNSMSKIVIASFDIECMSESGNFPQASNEGDKIIQIGTVLSYYGESEPFYKNLISLGGCTKIKGLEDVDIECYKNEKLLLLGWTKLIQKYNPDVITGYNINGFDFQYMHDRAKKLNILNQFSLLCKIKGENAPFKEKKLASSGLGDNLLKYFEINGRIIIDLMKVVQRDYKLDAYKLDFVASSFIKEKIIKYLPVFKKNSSNLSNNGFILTESIYGIKEDDYVNVMYNDGLTDNKHDKKYKILSITQLTDEQIQKYDLKSKKLFRIKINGTIPEDVFITNNKKNKVCWCHAKDDVSPNEMFKLFKGSDDDRGIIAKYCVMDCVLVTKLMEKLQILNNNIGMANVCHVPLTYIFMRGQGIKIFSLVSKKCRELNHLIPKLKVNYKQDNNNNNNHNNNHNLEHSKFKKITNNEFEDEEEQENVGYEGATVFPPVTGVHYEPIPVLDYASLYPRSMIYINISHECIVNDLQYDNLPNYNYKTVTYNNNDGTTTTCKFAQKIDNSKGILPLILVELLDKRSATKKLMEKADSIFLKNIYDGLQLAYKVTANSLYGQVGAPTSSIYMKELAASTTATGRKMLEFSRDFIEGTFGDFINYAIHDKEKFYDYAKDYYKDTPIHKFIEPKKNRNTLNDFLDYFHSTVNQLITNEFKVKPKVIYGDSVTGDTPILLLNQNNQIEIKTVNDIGKNWSEYNIFKNNIDGLSDKQQDNNINYKVWSDHGWTNIKRVIRHKTNKEIFEVLTHTAFVKVTSDHSLLDINGNQIKPKDCNNDTELLHVTPIIQNNKITSLNLDTIYNYGLSFDDCSNKSKQTIIPDEILNGSYEEKNTFLKGYYDSSNYIKNNTSNYYTFNIKNQVNALKLYCLLTSLNYHVFIDITYDHIFKLSFYTHDNTNLINYNNNNNYIKNIKNIGIINDYVYDLETDAGHFHAGIGNLIVKNTDSVFFSPKIYNIQSKEIKTDREALKICIELGKLAGDAICKILPEPEEQVYEKTLWPFIIITKKRYVGNLYEDDDSHFYQKSMGIVLKRRDNAKIVKIVVGGIIDYILNGGNNQTNTNSIQDRNLGAINYTKMLLKQILRGEFPIDKFIISKTLKSTYKNRGSIVHAVLADRIGVRDPGNKPNTNDRIPYVYIIPSGKVTLQGDRVEDPKYVIDNELELDYLFYITNQIMKPSLQFLDLIAVDPKKMFDNYINKEINRRKKISSIMDYVCIDNNSNHSNDSNVSNVSNNSNNSNVSNVSNNSNNSNNSNDSTKIIKKIKKNKSKNFSLTIEL